MVLSSLSLNPAGLKGIKFISSAKPTFLSSSECMFGTLMLVVHKEAEKRNCFWENLQEEMEIDLQAIQFCNMSDSH